MTTRITKVSGKKIQLTSNNPLERLRQFCQQGEYQHRFNWDKFQNCVSCHCNIYYRIDNKTVSLIQRAYVNKGTDITEAQNKVAAIILDELGLSPEEEQVPEETPEPFDTKNIANSLLNTLATSVKVFTANMDDFSDAKKKSWADIADETEN